MMFTSPPMSSSKSPLPPGTAAPTVTLIGPEATQPVKQTPEPVHDKRVRWLNPFSSKPDLEKSKSRDAESIVYVTTHVFR